MIQRGPVTLLDPDADEILLGLLARDAEQPPIHDRPHRRWVAPPAQYDPNEGTFREIKPGWWRLETPEESRELEKGRRVLDLERMERAKVWAQISYRYVPQPEPLDRWVENLRDPLARVPDWLRRELGL